MIFSKLFNRKKKLKKQMLYRIERFKENHKDEMIFEEYIIDKQGEDICLIGTYYEDSKLGFIYILGYLKELEKVIFTIEDEYLNLGDIQIFKYRNRGIGSKVITLLDNIASQNNVYKINGELHSESDEHKMIQEYFYTKNGFTINNNKLEKIII